MINREKLTTLLDKEEKLFLDNHPKSKELFEKAKSSLHEGVPMHWMMRWPGNFPMFVTEAKGAHFKDVDGLDYIDFCLGDTGAMTGHSPDESIGAIIEQLKKGITLMLPTEDALAVGDDLQKRFGLPYWQVATSATDANRFVLRIARYLTGRKYIISYNWAYHGTVDETFITLDEKGHAGPRPGSIGPQVNPTETTKCIEFNDLDALEAALATGDVACVLAEPAMTNIGIVLPDPGYHEKLRELTRKYGTYLIIDETHTMCAGPGGYTKAYGLDPDFLVVGKAIASGIPTAVYGFSAEISKKLSEMMSRKLSDVGGIGGTLAGSALQLAAMKATLANVLTEENYKKTIALAERFEAGVQTVIDEKKLPWIVRRLGCRSEYWFRPQPPKNGAEAEASEDPDLDRYMHLATLNRGILMTPFHNMALIAPQTTEADIDKHTAVFKEIVSQLVD